MKKITANFIANIILFVILMGQIFTGILLHRFSHAAADAAILGLTHYTWGCLHWAASVLFMIVILTHLILHWGWIKAAAQKYFRMASKVMLAIITILFLASVFAPFYLTGDLVGGRDNRGGYLESSTSDSTVP